MQFPEILQGLRPERILARTPVRRMRHRLFIMFVEHFSILPPFHIAMVILGILMG